MKSSKLCGIAAALLLAATGASAADAVNPYVHSSSGQVVKNSTDLCWRTGFWTPALAEAMGIDGAGCACDADILDKKACTAVEAPAPQQKSAEKVTFSADTLFNFDKATLKDEGRAVLDDLVSRVAGVDLEVILTTGYADRIGSDAYNLKLSQRRADAVKLHHRRVPREQRHRVSFAMQLTRAPLVALRAHHLDGHVAAGQLLVVQEHVREATLAERANPAEPRNLRASHTRDSWAHC